MGMLMGNVTARDATSKISLEILLHLSQSNIALVKPFTVFIKSLLDFTHLLQENEVEMLFVILSILAIQVTLI